MVVAVLTTPRWDAHAQSDQPTQNPPLVIAIDGNYAPNSIIGPDGRAYGLFVDFWRLWSEATGRPVVFEPTDWVGTLDAIRDGTADIHFGLFINEARSEWLDFSTAFHSIRTSVFFRSDYPGTPELSKLAGRPVGVIRGFFQEAFLRETYPALDVKAYEDSESLFLALLTGEIDALVNEVTAVDAQKARLGLRGAVKRSPETLLSNTVHAGILKGNPDLLETVNAGIAAIPQDQLIALDALWLATPLDRFYRQDPDQITLSPEQSQWIKDNPTVSLAVTNFIAPVDIIDDSGLYTGLNADLIDIINRKTSLNIVPEYYGRWEDVVRDTLAGTVEGAFSFSRTPEREEHVFYTQPYAYDPVIVITREDDEAIQSMADVAGKTVGAVRGHAFIEDLEQDLSGGSLVLYETETAALFALLDGDLDAHVTTQFIYSNAQRERYLPGLRVAASRQSEGGSLRIGIHKNNPVLFSIVQEALDSIPLEDLAALRQRWLTFEPTQQSTIPLTPAERQWIAQHPEVRLGVDRAYPPFEFVSANGIYQGIAADYLAEIGKRIGISFTVVPDLTWDEVIQGAKDRTVDLLPVVTDRAERREFLVFTEPYLEFPNVIVTHENAPEIDGLEDLAGSVVASPEGYSVTQFVRDDYPDILVEDYPTALDALVAVSTEKANATIGNMAVIGYLAQENSVSNIKIAARRDYSIGYSFGVRKDWPELASIITKVYDSFTREEHQAIRSQWIPFSMLGDNSIGPALSLAEQAWLRNHPNLTLGVDLAWAPFEFLDDQGNYAGIGSDYVRAVSERLGIEMTPIKDLSWPEVIAKAKAGEIDILPTLVKTPEREEFLTFTEPYISFPMVIATRKDAAFVDSLAGLEGERVGVVEGYVTHEILEAHHPNLTVVTVATVQDGLEQLEAGQFHAFVDNLVTITHTIDQQNFENIKIASPTQYAFDLSIGVRKGLEELVPIINKALATISEKERAGIVNTWTAVQISFGVQTGDIVIWGGSAAILTALIIGLLVLWARFVQKQKAQVERSERRLSSLIETAPDGIIVVDQAGVVQTFSPSAQAMFGYAEAEILGQNVSLLMPQAFATNHATHMDAYLRSGQSSAIGTARELTAQRKNGEQFPLELTLSEVVTSDQHAFIGMCRDISERKEAEHRLQDAHDIIRGSIDYAAHIQRSVLPDQDLLTSLASDHFVIWEPRDVVGGDFYWCKMWGEGLLVILCDCTGHGVPGAFMSLIATGALERAINEVQQGQVAELIQKMHQNVKITLGQHRKDGGSDDGLELGALFVNPDLTELTFVGARFDLFWTEADQVHQEKGTKAGIGYRKIPMEQTYTALEIEIRPGRSFYMSSDGLLDQVGGDRRRSFGKQRFKALLGELQGKAMAAQKEAVLEGLQRYQGDETRRDDVSVIGLSFGA